MEKLVIVIVAVVLIFGGYFILKGVPKQTDGPHISIPEVTLSVPERDVTVTATFVTSSTPTTTSTKIMNTVTMETSMGTIKLQLSRAQAPKTVENFVKLAQAGFYNGTRFHRVIAGFMIQGGDPLTKDLSQAGRWGTGGPGYTFADEITPSNRNDVGTIAMANAGPNTNGSQFFINVANNNGLNTKHTVFGKVVAGMDVVKKIETTPTDTGDRPVKEVVVTKIVISN